MAATRTVQAPRPKTARAVGAQIRSWRHRRGVSQLQLAANGYVSARHLSFVETGRSRPSRELVIHLAKVLGASNHELNLCLLRGGFAPHHDSGLDADSGLDSALAEMIERHNPLPANLFDSDWRISRINRSGRWLCSILFPRLWAQVSDTDEPLDMIATLAHPHGLLTQMRNAPEMGWVLLRQIRAEQVTNPALGPRADRLERVLHARYPAGETGARFDGSEPIMRLDFTSSHGPLSFMKTQNVLGTPQQITVATPRIELWLPLDAHTQRVLLGRDQPAVRSSRH